VKNKIPSLCRDSNHRSSSPVLYHWAIPAPAIMIIITMIS